MTAKVTISLPDELLSRLDAEAQELGVPRSELVQESLATYLGKTAEQRQADVKRARMEWALEQMETFEERHPTIYDTRPTLEILREIRETDDSAPMRDKPERGK
ncbi:MAG: ribbon-helix-helix protein, CopG family [Actinobacteria bacterium]|nr:ribbon-helix-helix protein, CopG family [Actinomycetota bacterium]